MSSINYITIVLYILLTACNDDDSKKKLQVIDPKNPVQEITIKAQGNTMDDMKFDVTLIETHPRTTLRITLVNESQDESMRHNFVLVNNNRAEAVAKQAVDCAQTDYVPVNDDVIVNTGLTHPGEISSVSFTSPEKGSYEYICTYPGHWAKMRGKLIVK